MRRGLRCRFGESALLRLIEAGRIRGAWRSPIKAAKGNDATRNEAKTNELGVLEPVLQYAERRPSVHSDAVATNLALTRTFLAVKDALTDYLSPQGLGLTRAEYHFLVLLYLAEDHRRPLSEMAKELSFSQGYITKLVDQLEDALLVERQASSVDRRITYAQLTPQGLVKCETIAPAFLEYMDEVGSVFSIDEMHQLRTLLAKYQASAERLSRQSAD
jgi:MarR family 2-MHQ and catechol resistance regulon transcriptional repressor